MPKGIYVRKKTGLVKSEPVPLVPTPEPEPTATEKDFFHSVMGTSTASGMTRAQVITELEKEIAELNRKLDLLVDARDALLSSSLYGGSASSVSCSEHCEHGGCHVLSMERRTA